MVKSCAQHAQQTDIEDQQRTDSSTPEVNWGGVFGWEGLILVFCFIFVP